MRTARVQGKAGRDETIRRLCVERGCVVIFVLVVLFCFPVDLGQ